MSEQEGRGADAPLPVVVIGAGMAGLTAAWWLHQSNVPVTVLERADHAGGVVGTTELGGHVFERGPSTVIASAPAVNELIDAVGLRDSVQRSNPHAHRRLIWRGGALHEAPSGPLSFLGSSLLGFGGKLRMLREPWVSARTSHPDETLKGFLERRIGPGATAAFADPFVTGVYAGRLEHLGADAFPRLVGFERDHGSLVRGMMASQKKAKAAGDGRELPKGLLSFDGGLQVLPGTIRKQLGTRLRFGHEVFGIEPVGTKGEGGWIVRAVAGGRHVDYDASAVVIATPSYVSHSLLERMDATLAAPIKDIPHPHVASVGLGYRRDAVAHPLDAFGLLCSSEESEISETGVLGVIFASTVFEGRAPANCVSLSVIMGGSRNPECAQHEDSILVDQARAGLAVLLGVRGLPNAVEVARWPRAIPQYQPGHGRRIAELREGLSAWHGLHLAGNYLDGVGLEQTVASGTTAARAILVANA
ncbi:MAG: protoporphyrinogen oxidase [Myxococcota bacterium]